MGVVASITAGDEDGSSRIIFWTKSAPLHKIVHSSAMYYQNVIIIHECSKKLLKMKNSKSFFFTPSIWVLSYVTQNKKIRSAILTMLVWLYKHAYNALKLIFQWLKTFYRLINNKHSNYMTLCTLVLILMEALLCIMTKSYWYMHTGASKGSEETKHRRGKPLPLQCFDCSENLIYSVSISSFVQLVFTFCWMQK